MTLNTKTNPATNGVAKETAPGAKVLTVTPPTPKEQDEPKPLEDRMHRINQLWQLQGKHQRLQESKTRLKKFLSEADKESLSITIKNGDYSREEFSTKNSAVIEDVLNCLLATIDVKIAEVEPLLNW